jgi:hypothetical protein
MIRRLLILLVFCLPALVPLKGCGGVPLDASELQQWRVEAVADIRAEREATLAELRRILTESRVTVDSPQVDRLLQYIDRLQVQLDKLQAEIDEARAEPERAAAPEPPTVGVQ